MDPRHHSGKPALEQRQEFPLLEHLNLNHPLIVLAKLIDWNAIDQVAYEAMGPRHRRPPLRPRLVAGLLYLQHTFDLSDEEVVWGWVENPYWVRRETGKVQVVKVHCDEGVANHIGPEPCVVAREGGREASVGVHVGQPWSHEMVHFPDADVLQYAEGNTYGRVIASTRRSGVVEEPGMHVSALRGNREISRLACCRTGQVRIGKARSRSR